MSASPSSSSPSRIELPVFQSAGSSATGTVDPAAATGGCAGSAHPLKRPLRSKKSRWFIRRYRVGVLIGLNLLMVSHLLLERFGVVRAGHSDPTDLYLFFETGRVKIVAVVFGTWLLSVPFLGRAGCGWFCHMGAWQEFLGWVMEKLKIYQHKAVHSKWVAWGIPSLFPVFFLTALGYSWYTHGFMYQGIHYDPTKDTSPVWEFGLAGTLFFILPLLSLPVMLLGTRAICRYTCPFNLYFRLLEKISLRKIVKVGTCVNCTECSKVCKMGIEVMGQVQTYGYVKDVECIKCMTCVQTCPTQALSYELVTPKERKALTAMAPPKESVPLYEREFLSTGTELYLALLVLGAAIAAKGHYEHLMLFTPWAIGVGLLLLMIGRKIRDRVVRRRARLAAA